LRLWGKKSVTLSATLAQPSLSRSLFAQETARQSKCIATVLYLRLLVRYNTIDTFRQSYTLSCSFLRRVCATLARGHYHCYVHHRVLSHKPARGGAHQQEERQEGRGAVLRTSPCTSYYYQSIRRRRRDGAVLLISPCIIIINSINFNHQHGVAGSARETQEAGGVLCCAVMCYAWSRMGVGSAVLLCTIINHYRSTRRTRRVFQRLRYFK
jgi:hypothetical protein